MTVRRYSISNLRRALTDPALLLEEVQRLSDPGEINKILNGILYRFAYRNQFDVMAGDWDNLLILDGCRCDYFRRSSEFDGEFDCVVSKGSHSIEFLEKTFVGREFHDTVYITANPHAPRLIGNEFHATKTLYRDDRHDVPRDHLPENVMKMAESAFEEYPDKRYLIHLMQPNIPFLGPTAEDTRRDLLERHRVVFPGVNNGDLPAGVEPAHEFASLKQASEAGFLPLDRLRECYSENVEIAIEYATKLLGHLEGRTVITADHGEMLGERMRPLFTRQFGHDPNLYTDELRRVPWVVIESGDRRQTRSDPPQGKDDLGDELVRNRLEHLGYAEFALRGSGLMPMTGPPCP